MKYIWFGGLTAILVATAVYTMQPLVSEAPDLVGEAGTAVPAVTTGIGVVPDAVDAGMPYPNLTIRPIEHASFVMYWGETTFYVDPVGDVALYSDYGAPEIVLLTDVHGDHLSTSTLAAVVTEETIMYAPQAVYDLLPASMQEQTMVLVNGQSVEDTTHGLTVAAVAMYNTTEERLNYHPEGRGNGYVLSRGERIYIAGDTEGTPEMAALDNINVAFMPMNLPYTMGVEAAAEAVASFSPDIVYPYHYRGPDGLSDIDAFATALTATEASTYVGRLNWYPDQAE